MFQLRATPQHFLVEHRDGRALDAVVSAEPAFILGVAAGALSLVDATAAGLLQIDGDEAAVHQFFSTTSHE
ncbi:hypothetical protein [Gordonia sp. NPDC127522]|uniref:hypothetical protein n=1 Tax=Gordonia sp. NPDC127522 TaxID=3345390 RepID=UPI003627FDC6